MKIFYWSGTGNTESMANLIAKGISESNIEVEVINISVANNIDVKGERVIGLGCPSMGAEELEEAEFQPFLDSIKEDLVGKKVVLFGSYGWGDGEWMRNWEEEMTSLGSNIPLEPLIVNNYPEGNTEVECIEYGREISKLL